MELQIDTHWQIRRKPGLQCAPPRRFAELPWVETPMLRNAESPIFTPPIVDLITTVQLASPKRLWNDAASADALYEWNDRRMGAVQTARDLTERFFPLRAVLSPCLAARTEAILRRAGLWHWPVIPLPGGAGRADVPPVGRSCRAWGSRSAGGCPRCAGIEELRSGPASLCRGNEPN